MGLGWLSACAALPSFILKAFMALFCAVFCVVSCYVVEWSRASAGLPAISRSVVSEVDAISRSLHSPSPRLILHCTVESPPTRDQHSRYFFLLHSCIAHSSHVLDRTLFNGPAWTLHSQVFLQRYFFLLQPLTISKEMLGLSEPFPAFLASLKASSLPKSR